MEMTCARDCTIREETVTSRVLAIAWRLKGEYRKLQSLNDLHDNSSPVLGQPFSHNAKCSGVACLAVQWR
jgi:hypothetical protein